MLDHRHRCIFIHQRKCAGTSIIRAFGYRPEHPEWHVFNNGVLEPEWLERSTDVQEYFVFSAVRNPFDRAVSGWRYLPETRERSLREVLLDPPLDGHAYRHFTRPQVAILADPATGQLVTHALIRFENLQQDFNAVCAQIGMKATKLPWEGKGKRKRTYREYFDAETRRLAEAMFGEDLERFGYDF